MSADFPEPGPRTGGTRDREVAAAMATHVAKARQRRALALVPPTPSPTPAPSTYRAAAFDVEAASNGEDPWREEEVDRLTNGAPAPGFVREILPLTDGTSIVTDRLMSEPRKSRFHANATQEKDERRFDKTALHFDKHGRLMSHADYIAHCEKYDYAWRSIQRGDRILDVGCGTDAPLMRAINFVQSQAAKVLDREGGCYVGVDLNRLKETKIAWAQLIGELDMTSDDGFETALRAIPGNDPEPAEGMRGYSLIVCLEVIEHMDVADGTRLLENMRDLLSPEGRIILSTPVYDGKGQARNHIHEYYIPELQGLIESVGLVVKRRMGTFTSEPALKRWMKANRPDWYALYMEAREFHSSGYMSGVIAPMVPDISRNNVWVLESSG